jgi:hypothetical protein
MERSRLGLLVWFRAIEAVLSSPSASTADLIEATGIRREGTVRRMAGQIRQAMNSSQWSVLLVGLDRVFGAPACDPAEPSVGKN